VRTGQGDSDGRDLLQLKGSRWDIRTEERDGGRRAIYAKSCNATHEHLPQLLKPVLSPPPSQGTRSPITDRRSLVTPHVSWHAPAQLLTRWNLVCDPAARAAPVPLAPPLRAVRITGATSTEAKDLRAEPSHDALAVPRLHDPRRESGSMSPSLQLWTLHATIAKLSYDDLLLQALSPSNRHSPRLRRKTGSPRVISQL